MFVTHDINGKVTAYSDKSRNIRDLQEGETEVEVDMEFNHVACVEGGLVFEEGQLKNSGEVIATEIVEEPAQPEEIVE